MVVRFGAINEDEGDVDAEQHEPEGNVSETSLYGQRYHKNFLIGMQKHSPKMVGQNHSFFFRHIIIYYFWGTLHSQ